MSTVSYSYTPHAAGSSARSPTAVITIDGMIVVWSPSDKPSVSYGSDAANEEAEYSKEFWRARIIIRCTTREVYDLAWSPNSEWIVAGSTDNTARIFNAVDGVFVFMSSISVPFTQRRGPDAFLPY